MPKQLNINMSVTADTSQARKQLQDLQKTLGDLASNSIKNNIGKTMDADLQKAVVSARQLKDMIAEASNTKTGNLDLSKFSQEIQKSGRSIQQYAQDLSNLGADGTKAFMQLAQSVAAAEVPMKRTFGWLEQFRTALANTVRWQVSSSVLHGLVGAVQGAYGYAQDLNKSLTDIRIVTGQSTEEMARFADQANRSAQALSTSTLAYTDAALIYYQQGLEGQDVADRVETTLKLSNVTGESADEVSSYMTAIWNNFRKGGEDLESFADKITALGAATASSSREIAGGLQQFAAIADTVGLSYDYAASALATVVAQTRQSEDTVGNAFRTIFSRLEGLKLGDTLEDGTDLNKYSGALQTIGVNIKDQNGELKQMDTILEEIGAKWQTLSRDQQVALAQTVGGVRQYANLIALFDNWDKFQQNLAVSQGAEGTLDEQARRYEESWQAAQKRVQAAWQAIYQDLISDKFFIDLLNGIKDALNWVDKLIKAIGGLKGVLSLVGAVVTTVFAKDIANGIDTAIYNFKVFTGTAQKEANEVARSIQQLAEQQAQVLVSEKFEAEAKVFKDQIDFTMKLRENTDQITEANRKQLLSLNEVTKEYGNAYIAAKKLKEESENKAGDKSVEMMQQAMFSDKNTASVKTTKDEFYKAKNGFFGELTEYKQQEQALREYMQTVSESNQSIEEQQRAFKDLFIATSDVHSNYVGLTNLMDSYDDVLQQEKNRTLDSVEAAKKKKEILLQINTILEDAKQREEAYNIKLAETAKNLADQHKEWGISAQDWMELARLQEEVANSSDKAAQAEQNYRAQVKKSQIALQGALNVTNSYADAIVDTARGISQLKMALSSFKTMLDALNNTDATWGKRISDALPSLVAGLSSGAFALKTLTKEGTFTGNALRKISTAFIEGKAASLTFAGGLKAAAIAAGEILLPLALVAAAIGGIIWLINDFHSKSLEGQLEASNKKLEEAAEKAEKASKAYNDLKNSLEEYKTVREEISKMPAGEERAAAILEENEKILSFLDENNLWETVNSKDFGGIQYDANGLIKIDEIQQKILTNKAYENKLAEKRVEYEEKLKNLELERDKNYKDTYTGKKFEGKIYSDVNENGQIDEDEKEAWTRGGDFTKDIAKALNKSGLTLNAIKENPNAVRQAIENSDNESLKLQVDDVMSWLGDLANGSEKDIEAFNKLATTIGTTEAAMSSYKMSMAQMAIGQEVYDTTDNSLAQQGLLEVFANLPGDLQDKIQTSITEGGQSLAEAFRQAGVDVAQMIAEAEQIQKEDLTNKIANNGANRGDINLREDVENWVNGLSEDKLKIAAELDIDYDDTLEDVQQKLEDKINNTPVELDTNGLTKKQAEELQEEFEQLTDYITQNAEAIDGLDDHLANCAREASVVARAILRFDDAIQDVTEHYDEWTQALTSGSVQSAAKAAAELQDAYGNLMDIDGSQLSSDFLESTENLDLMKQAIEGNEEAYNRLLELSGEDIIAHLELDPADMAAFQSQLEVVKGLMKDFPNLEVGANLDTGNFLEELTNLVNAAGMTAEQATAYLASMGIDAEVTKVPAETEPVTETHNYWVPAEYEPASIPTGGDEEGVSGNFKYYKQTSAGHWSSPEPSSHEEESAPTAFTLKVTSAHKSSGGAFKYKQASHGGGGVSPSKGKGGGGKGGGGSKDKKKTTKEHAKKERVEDRYHNIKSAIDAVSKSLQRLNKLQDRAYGKSKLKYMDQEIDKLKEQVKLTDEYIKEAKQYLALDRKNLVGTGMGAEFDTDGRLINYEQVLQKMVESYNAAVDKYNGSVDAFNVGAQEEADNEALENAKKQLDKAKEIYDDNKKILDQYEKTYQELQTQVDKKIELLNEIYDKKLAKVVWKVDIQLEVNDADIKYLEWLNKQLGRVTGRTVDIMANLSKAAQDTERNIAAVNQGIVDLFANHDIKLDFSNLNPDQLVAQLREFMAKEGLGSELTEAEAKQIRDWNDKLMEYIDNWVDYWLEAHEKIDETFKEYSDKIDREIDKLEEFTDILDHYNKIIDLTGAQLGMSDEDVLRIHDTKIRNGENELRALRAEREEVSALLQEAQENLANAETEEARKLWEGHVQEIEDRLKELDSNIRSQWEDVLSWAQDRFDKALEAASKKFEDRFDNLSLLMERFERQQEADHLYLDDYEKYHELNKDVKELEKMIDNTNNTMMRSKYADYLDKVRGYMSSGVKLSQAQTDLIAKRVELLKAEDDLLNARNAKNMVRMTRDNEGNFSYTYTADQDQIDNAELGYNDAFYNLQKSTRDYQEETQGDMLNKLSDFNSRSQELLKQRESGQITPEQYSQAMAELQAQYQAYMQWYLEQMGFFYDEEGILRDEDLANLEEFLDIKLADYDDFITEYEDSILGRLFDDVDSEYEFVENAISAEEQLLADNTEAAQQWEYDIQEICAAAGVEVDKFRETVLTDLANIDQKSIETKEKVTEMAKKMKEDMDEIMKKALQMDQDWANRMQSMRDQIAATIYAMNAMLASLADVTNYEYQAGQAALYAAGAFAEMGNAAAVAAQQVNDLANALNNVAGAGGGSGGGGSPYQTTTYSNSNAAELIKKGVNSNKIKIYDDPYGVSGTKGILLGGELFKIFHDNDSRVKMTGTPLSYTQWVNQLKKFGYYLPMDTGGYTGAWGSEGRLALLHEKELVLNKEDTVNILNVVDSVRSMVSNFGNNVLNDFAKAITNSGSLALAGAGTLDQNVHIEASFPNVQSHTEIELALNNLINSASQYVNRK